VTIDGGAEQKNKVKKFGNKVINGAKKIGRAAKKFYKKHEKTIKRIGKTVLKAGMTAALVTAGCALGGPVGCVAASAGAQLASRAIDGELDAVGVCGNVPHDGE
jgi:hypothetical protein